MAPVITKPHTINLPAPQKKGGLAVNKAFAERRSCREYDSTKELNLKTISNLLWSTCGINRPKEGLRTNPTGMNSQEIDVYWFDKTGVYLYDYKRHSLKEIAEGDFRHLLAGTPVFNQEFVMDAPCAVLFVVDSNKLPQEENYEPMSLIDVGIAIGNLNLFCAGNGLSTIPRITMDEEGIRDVLHLPPSSHPAANSPIGYAKQP